jgi:hypothetical protein
LLADIRGVVFADVNANGFQDGREGPLQGVTIFLDQNRNGRRDSGETFTTTDSRGRYAFQNLAAGTYWVAQELPSGTAQSTPGPRGKTGSAYDIELIFNEPGRFSKDLKALVRKAADRWERIITGDAPTFGEGNNQGFRVIDDIAIQVNLTRIDGPGGTLANAAPLVSRSTTDVLPAFAQINLDSEDINNPALLEIAIHEFGHALGFTGDYFRQLGLLRNSGTGAVQFVGPNAVREFNLIYGESATGVPFASSLNTGGGTAEGHWDEDLLEGELMTGFAEQEGITEYLSKITVGAMQDLGYGVDYDAADFFEPFATSQKLPDLRLLPFTHTVYFPQFNRSRTQVNFGNLPNNRPTVESLIATDNPTSAGSLITLEARDVADRDIIEEPRGLVRNEDAPEEFFLNLDTLVPFYVDRIEQVVFWRESNGTPGLQSNDTYIGADRSPEGRWRVQTNAADGGIGTQTFYTRAFDRYGHSSNLRTVTVQVFSNLTVPNAPSDLSGISTTGRQIELNWADNANNESRFQLVRSDTANFSSGNRTFTLGANTSSFVDTAVTPGRTYFYRVRAGNGTGVSAYTPVVSVTALSGSEVILDNTSPGVTIVGDWFSSTGGSGFVGPNHLNDGNTGKGSKSVSFSPSLASAGEYFVYARYVSGNDRASNVPYNIFHGNNGDSLTTVTIDQRSRGGAWVLLGKFRFGTDNGVVRVSNAGTNGIVSVDSVRFLSASGA